MVVSMGHLPEEMIRLAVRSLVVRDESLQEKVFAQEEEVNALQVKVDEMAVRLTILQQPVARDARFLFMASRIGGELERIADQAINISQNARHVIEAPPLPPLRRPDRPRGAGTSAVRAADLLMPLLPAGLNGTSTPRTGSG